MIMAKRGLAFVESLPCAGPFPTSCHSVLRAAMEGGAAIPIVQMSRLWLQEVMSAPRSQCTWQSRVRRTSVWVLDLWVHQVLQSSLLGSSERCHMVTGITDQSPWQERTFPVVERVRVYVCKSVIGYVCEYIFDCGLLCLCVSICVCMG